MQGRRKKKGLIAVVALGTAALLSAAPASAACVSAEASFTPAGGTKQYIVGPKKCVVSTPWAEGPDVWVNRGHSSVGTAEVHVWTAWP